MWIKHGIEQPLDPRRVQPAVFCIGMVSMHDQGQDGERRSQGQAEPAFGCSLAGAKMRVVGAIKLPAWERGCYKCRQIVPPLPVPVNVPLYG